MPATDPSFSWARLVYRNLSTDLAATAFDFSVHTDPVTGCDEHRVTSKGEQAYTFFVPWDSALEAQALIFAGQLQQPIFCGGKLLQVYSNRFNPIHSVAKAAQLPSLHDRPCRSDPPYIGPATDFEHGEGQPPRMFSASVRGDLEALPAPQDCPPGDRFLREPGLIKASPAYNGELDVNFTVPGEPMVSAIIGFEHASICEAVDDCCPRRSDYADLRARSTTTSRSRPAPSLPRRHPTPSGGPNKRLD